MILSRSFWLGPVVAVFIGSLAANAQQTPLPSMVDIEAAWAREDFDFVRENLRRHAEETDSSLVLFRYARTLVEGRGGPVDIPQAAALLERAVAEGHTGAVILLARILLTDSRDDGPAADPERAAALLMQAAAASEPEAQLLLSRLYRLGTGVEANAGFALTWLRSAAENSNLDAQFELGMQYAQGNGGVTQDGIAAERWLSEAANSGHVRSQLMLARFKAGAGRQDEAFAWYDMAARGGSLEGARESGLRLLQGNGVAQAVPDGLARLQVAAQAGDDLSITALGHHAEDSGDLVSARDFYVRAAAYINPDAMLALARFHIEGLGGGPVDPDAAFAILRRALNEGVTEAQISLGEMAIRDMLGTLAAPHQSVPWVLAAFQAGVPGAQDWLRTQAEVGIRPAQSALGRALLEDGEAAAAAPLLQAAAEAGDVPAQAALGEIYVTGTGVEVDYVAAHTWLNLAAAQGWVSAVATRDTVTALMTPEEVATAQAGARSFLAGASARAPQTNQSVTVNAPPENRP